MVLWLLLSQPIEPEDLGLLSLWYQHVTNVFIAADLLLPYHAARRAANNT